MGLCAASASVTARLPRPHQHRSARSERRERNPATDLKQDQTTTEPAPPLRWAGIDWSWSEHAICVVDEEGVAVERTTVEHSGAGLTRMVTLLDQHRVAGIAIERGDGPVVQALLEAGLTVFLVASRQVTALRSRYGTAGNKDDRFDAYLLADVLRTDRRRLTPVATDTPATEGLRMLVRARRDLVAARVAAHNQLHNHLKTAFPGAVGLFSQLDGKTSLAFLTRFPTPQKARWLSEKRLAAWLAAAHYSNKRTPAQFMAHLRQAPVGLPEGPAADAAAAVTGELVALLTNLRERIAALENHIAQALDAHVDAAVFTGLPHAGTVRAATLLAEIGDARGRPHRRRSGRRSRGLPLDPRLRALAQRGVPPRLQPPPTPSRGGLRRRQPRRQPVGPGRLRQGAHPRRRACPCRARARPRLGPRHLALLDRPHPLRPCPPPRLGPRLRCCARHRGA
jgi:transposase